MFAYLEDVLIALGAGKPFRRIKGDGASGYELSVTGSTAYDRLINIVYFLENIGAIDSAERAVRVLDELVDSQY